MAIFCGPRTPFSALRNSATGSFWSPRVVSSLFQDQAGTIPAEIGVEVKRMNDLGGLGNHFLALNGSRTIDDHTYVFKGPILRKEQNIYYLDFSGDGTALRVSNANGDWPPVTGSNSFGIFFSVAFQTYSQQPDLPNTGFSGTWMGSESIGNLGNQWFFGVRLNQANSRFYATVRNVENTEWVQQFRATSIYTNLSTSQFFDRPIIYSAAGYINNDVYGGGEWIDRKETALFEDRPFDDTSRLPVPFNNTFSIGARQASNDNWIAGRFYGGAMMAKYPSDEERTIIEDFLYTNSFT
jgi:hypothetical protein